MFHNYTNLTLINKNLLIKERFCYFTAIYLMQGIFRDDKKSLFVTSK